MFKPKYPTPDTYVPTAHIHAPVPVEQPARPAPAPVRSGVVDLVRSNPAAAVTGFVVTGVVLTSMLLAVAITGLALSISGVVLLLLVRMARQEFRR
ncbi:SpdD protein [Streptomyces lunaelactis]|uniref:SpdD protein n=1 Tax=Streptomyces lunaelactis TaxID=1535768 RepID=UPI00158515E9|nr:SpdD protein [Streptomyces lunaelactis]NUL04648.1 SpdD protein [Streptomyces lunaelactis]